MPLHESLEYFPLFDVELVGDSPSGSAAVGDRVAALGSPSALGGAGAVAIYCYSKDRNAWGYVGVITGSKETGPQQVRGMGSSLAAVGGTLIVGAQGDDETPGKVFVLSAPYGVWSYTTIPVISELQRDKPAGGDRFGAAVANCSDGDDDFVAVAAPGAAAPPGVPGPGQVFVFKGIRSSSKPWSTTPIANPNPEGSESDGFGSSLAIDTADDGSLVLAVGAPGAGQGQVHVARTTAKGTSFSFGATIGPVFPLLEGMEEPFETTAFGTAVALSGGSTLLVGAPDDPNFDEEIEGTGAVWFYKDADGTFEPLEERLYGPVEGARFGHSLAVTRADGAGGVDSDGLIVGAPGAGAAFLCTRAPGAAGFVRETPLVRISGKRPDGFGWAVSTSPYQDGTWYFVVAPGDANAGVDSGGFLYADGESRPTWMDIPRVQANPPIRWGGLNQDWWKKFTPGIETYVEGFLAQPEAIRERALATAAEGLG